MKRRLVWVLFLVSLALLVVTAGVAVGAWGPWRVSWGDSRKGVGYWVGVDTYGARIWMVWVTPGMADILSSGPRRLPGGWDRAGFHSHGWEDVQTDISGAVLPGYGDRWVYGADIGWFLTVFGALTMMFGIPSVWRAFRKKAGNVCRGCGYDLRASVGRCPECGKEVGR